MNHRFSEKGQALILITFAMIGLVGFGALAIDGGRVLSDRRHAQNAADTAAYSAALANAKGENITTAAQTRAASNGYDNGNTNDVIVTVTNTPSGVCPSNGKDITITIVSNVDTTFARVIGRNQVENTVKAIARSCDYYTTGGAPLYNGNAVTALNTSSCNGRPSKNLYVGGSGQLQIWGSGLGSASTDGGCVDFSGGQTQLHKDGSNCGDLVTAASSIPSKNLKKLEDPDKCSDEVYNATFAPPPADLGITCSTNAVKTGNTLSPGNWNTSTISPGSISTLQPGTYCITGEIHLTGGTFSGNGVTLVMLNNRLKLTGQAQMNIKAPTSEYDSFGNYTKGLLIYYPPGNASDLHMEGSSDATLSGTVLAQSSNCYFTGNGQIQKAKLQFICDTWQMNGNGQGELVWDSSVLFSPKTIVNPTVSLLQ